MTRKHCKTPEKCRAPAKAGRCPCEVTPEWRQMMCEMSKDPAWRAVMLAGGPGRPRKDRTA